MQLTVAEPHKGNISMNIEVLTSSRHPDPVPVTDTTILDLIENENYRSKE